MIHLQENVTLKGYMLIFVR